MAKKTREDALKTRTRILASALSLFSKNGYDHTTFNDIAARLKMTKGAVYWHFESKEALLLALVDEMLVRFRRIIERRMPVDRLSFPVVADVMSSVAAVVAAEPSARAFFMLMHTQVRWGSATMAKVREELLTDDRFGPAKAFRSAIENDKRSGLVRRDVAVDEVVGTCIAIWDGLVRSRIDSFLACDLKSAVRHAYDAIWRSLKV